MKELLKILLVEDSELDALLIVKLLQRGGYKIHWEMVETAEDMGKALQKNQWDLILSDYNMPRFNGMEALKVYQSHNLDIPFILVSGAIGEETSVKVMKAGAHDYILKDKLIRLIPAIKRELRDAEIRRQYLKAQSALKESEEKFRLFFKNQPEYCYIISPEGVIQDINQAVLKILGYTKQELVGSPIKAIYAPEVIPKVQACFKRWQKTGILENEELVILTRQGQKRTVLLSASTVKDKDGRVLHSVSVQRDVTEQKKAEEEKERLIQELQDALHRVKMLSGLLPICASCKKIRDDKGYWTQVESYITDHSDAKFSHGLCPECAEILINESLPLESKSRKKK